MSSQRDPAARAGAAGSAGRRLRGGRTAGPGRAGPCWAGRGGGGSGPDGHQPPNEPLRGGTGRGRGVSVCGLCVWRECGEGGRGRMGGGGCKTCWGQAEGPRRQPAVLSAGERGVSPESSGLVNLISCQNSHGNEAALAQRPAGPAAACPPWLRERLCGPALGPGREKGPVAGPCRRFKGLLAHSRTLSTLPAVAGPGCVRVVLFPPLRLREFPCARGFWH